MNDKTNLKEETPSSGLMQIIKKIGEQDNIDIASLNDLIKTQIELSRKEKEEKQEVEFNKAMINAISEIPSFKTTKTAYNYKYAPLDQINKVITPILKKYDLFISFDTSSKIETSSETSAYFITVNAKITHSLGYYKIISLSLPVVDINKIKIQGLGSAISYGKRYLISALLNITTHDDDDGVATQTSVNDDQLKRFEKGLEVSGCQIDKFLEFMKVDKLKDIKTKDFTKGINYLNNILKEKEKNNGGDK